MEEFPQKTQQILDHTGSCSVDIVEENKRLILKHYTVCGTNRLHVLDHHNCTQGYFLVLNPTKGVALICFRKIETSAINPSTIYKWKH
ncbi:hypothetical protein FKM82_020587 [Ascaphus truei]